LPSATDACNKCKISNNFERCWTKRQQDDSGPESNPDDIQAAIFSIIFG
jgi:hypothetical protein